MTAFDQALAMILRLEGKATDDPRDPGGVTNHGISIRFAGSIRLDVDEDGDTDRDDVLTLSVEEAAIVYRDHFWDRLRCGDMPPCVGIAVFDCAVNQGPAAAANLIQKSARVKVDGDIGPKTLAVLTAKGPAVLVEFMARRALRYVLTKNFDVFGLGWLTRLFVVYRESVLLEGKE